MTDQNWDITLVLRPSKKANVTGGIAFDVDVKLDAALKSLESPLNYVFADASQKSDFGPGESDNIMTSNIIYDDKMFLQVLLAVRQNGWILINSISASDPTTSEPQKHFIFQKSVNNNNNETSRQDSSDVPITPRSPTTPPPPPPPRIVSGKVDAAASASGMICYFT